MTALHDALAALTTGDWALARERAGAAASADPGSRLAAALAGFLGRLPATGVYDEPSGFEAFIDHGGNPELYRRTIAALAEVHRAEAPDRVLDIGCGDGRVTAAALGPATTRLDLVEPSAELLAAAERSVDAGGRPDLEVLGHQAGIDEVLAGLDPAIGWDLVQSTFALHTTRPEDRPGLFAELARRTPLLLIVEFDVPALADRSAAHVAYLADRYERGIREYADHPEVVTDFLLPVLVGQLDPSRPRYTFEQPIDAWADLATAAGFTATVTPVSPYWWADAHLVTARR